MRGKFLHKHLDKETNRYRCLVQCGGCEYTMAVWFSGWDAISCHRCKEAIYRPKTGKGGSNEG